MVVKSHPPLGPKPPKPCIPRELVEQTPYSTQRNDLQGSLDMFGESGDGIASWKSVWVELSGCNFVCYDTRAVR